MSEFISFGQGYKMSTYPGIILSHRRLYNCAAIVTKSNCLKIQEMSSLSLMDYSGFLPVTSTIPPVPLKPICHCHLERLLHYIQNSYHQTIDPYGVNHVPAFCTSPFLPQTMKTSRFTANYQLENTQSCVETDLSLTPEGLAFVKKKTIV